LFRIILQVLIHFMPSFDVKDPIQYGDGNGIEFCFIKNRNSIVKLGILVPAKICEKFRFSEHVFSIKTGDKIQSFITPIVQLVPGKLRKRTVPAIQNGVVFI